MRESGRTKKKKEEKLSKQIEVKTESWMSCRAHLVHSWLPFICLIIFCKQLLNASFLREERIYSMSGQMRKKQQDVHTVAVVVAGTEWEICATVHRTCETNNHLCDSCVETHFSHSLIGRIDRGPYLIGTTATVLCVDPELLFNTGCTDAWILCMQASTIYAGTINTAANASEKPVPLLIRSSNSRTGLSMHPVVPNVSQENSMFKKSWWIWLQFFSASRFHLVKRTFVQIPSPTAPPPSSSSLTPCTPFSLLLLSTTSVPSSPSFLISRHQSMVYEPHKSLVVVFEEKREEEVEEEAQQ